MTPTETTQIRLVNQGDQEYISEDGRIRVVLDHTFETECDVPHPVMMRLDEFTRYYSRLSAEPAADKWDGWDRWDGLDPDDRY